MRYLNGSPPDKHALKPDSAKVEAITNMAKPQDIEGVQGLSGFINYLAKFLPKVSEVMEPIRCLKRVHHGSGLRKKTEHFKTCRSWQQKLPSYYDPSNELIMQCDASLRGLGAASLQNGRPIEYASRALTKTETRSLKSVGGGGRNFLCYTTQKCGAAVPATECAQ